MVYKQNKLSFESDDSVSCQLAFHHMKQVESENHLVPLVCHNFPEKNYVSDGCPPEENKNVDCEAVKLENNKRPLDEEENLEASTKRTKHLDEDFPNFSELSFSNFLTDDTSIKDTSVSKRSSDSYDGSFSFPRFSGLDDYSARYESPIRISSFPGYYNDSIRPVVYNNEVEEEQPSIFDYRPRKPVAIGRNHQAELPSLSPKTSWASNELTEISTEKYTASHSNPTCHCLDAGSIRCVRQHIEEARENIESAVGLERFSQLGFSEMGESVALKWTEKEESLFHKVVISNPASVGKNFWNELYRTFPSRSSKEIVSYYFNVYMLRKRAEQNRFDPSNADSDDDEWQLEEEEEEEEEEEDDDDDEKDGSAVESPEDGCVGTYSGVHVCDDGSDNNDECVKLDFGAKDVNDDSCTSYEDPKTHKVEILDHGLSCMDGHDFFDHCCHIPWDMMNYASSLDKEPDLLPTSNVIEQFGDGTWE